MPRFDVYRNSGAHAVTPYLLDVQSDLLQGLETPKLAAVPLRLLKTKVATLAASRFEITAALDFLFQRILIKLNDLRPGTLAVIAYFV